VCGICGILDLDGRSVDARAVERMTAVLEHRGPDSQGVHCEGRVGLGATRLAILDLERANQPMLSGDGAICVVHNGEVLNHAALRAQLEGRGHRFRTSGDTEVILELYRAHGAAFAEHLRGMFATAIWDAPQRRLLLVRDPLGIKPLFYRRSAESLSFASELKALVLLEGFSREVDEEALHSFLAHNAIPAPHTIFKEARKLPAGHLLVCQDNQVTITRFARPSPSAGSALREGSDRVLASELRERLRDSVRAHLVSDVPVGVFLSGGVDSSILTALAAQEGSTPPATFSIGFEEASFNELEQARLVSERYGTDHHELVLRPDAGELLSEVVAGFDEPFGDSSALPTFLLARMASEHVKVVLSGEGADELFGGYETYLADLLAERGAAPLRVFAPLVNRLPSSDGRVSLEYRAKRFLGAVHLPALERHLGWKEIFSAAQRARLLAPRWRAHQDPLIQHRRRFAETADAPMLARLQDLDLGIYLADDLLVKTDRMTMAHGLEARVPFLDPAVWDFALALKTSQKVRRLQKKRLLREAARPWLPSRILDGRKRGFSIPAAAWLRGELRPMAEEILSASVIDGQGFFEAREVGALLEQHISRRHDHSRQLWGLLSFTIWAEGIGAQTGA
jgi:asparagine synthase (glutamine-hydrolysing)